MSNQTTQNYYLINLSTRNVSVSTHLRAENFTLGTGKCIYLGHLTDEQVVKYHRYSALNLSLRILTPDKAQSILNKSINATESLKESILGGKPQRVEHEAGSIASSSFGVYGVAENRKSAYSQKTTQKPLQSVSKGDAVESSKKEAIVEDHKKNTSEKIKEKNEEGTQESTVEHESSIEELKSDDDESNVVEKVDDSLLPRQIDVVEENAKIELEKMSYSELYDLAKASNITFKKKPSRQKLIDALASAQK